MYGKFAFNFAMSIKKHSPDLKIQLICDNEGIAGIDERFFDVVTKVDKLFCHSTEMEQLKFVPAKGKLGIYKYAAFDENIFLDVDAVCIKPIENLFDKCQGKEFATQVFDYCDSKATDFPNMLWAHPREAWKHFGLAEDARLPATNSSFIYFKKGKIAEEIFETARRELLTNPLHRDSHRMKWGKGQPDELYLNVALAKLNYDASIPNNEYVIFFSNKRLTTVEEIKYPIIGLYGPRGAIHSTIVDYCDRIMRNLAAENNVPHFKYHSMAREKFQHKTY